MTASKLSQGTEQVFTALHDNTIGQPLALGANTMLSAVTTSHREVIEFCVMRFEKDRQTLLHAMECRNWRDALEVQSRWAREMVEDYSSSVTKMLSADTGGSANNGEAKRGRA